MEFVGTPDGRRLAVETWGDPNGSPVFLLHGTPGSRLGPHPRDAVLYRQRIRMIAYDRPGYGGSDRSLGRVVGDAATDTAAIADAFGIDRFAVVGRSGGGPHALACAALLPERVTRAAALVTLAPPDADGLDWFAGMSQSNVREYTIASSGGTAFSTWVEEAADVIRADPRRLILSLLQEVPEPDRRIVADAGIRAMLAGNFAEALRESAHGWVDDSLAFRSPWGFEPRSIDRPVVLWHGEDDVFSPVGHAQWLAEEIPTAQLVRHPGAAHFGALGVLPNLLPWLVADVRAA
ncbi:alpha/beta hydrolase [Cryptosporangium japonicum]|uniref:Alpha/beta hydrolase n=1 Tax=Cryptosporangium japonicum TaxID=80872 RepID=A0ABN0TKJ1_9ACTN